MNVCHDEAQMEVIFWEGSLSIHIKMSAFLVISWKSHLLMLSMVILVNFAEVYKMLLVTSF